MQDHRQTLCACLAPCHRSPLSQEDSSEADCSEKKKGKEGGQSSTLAESDEDEDQSDFLSQDLDIESYQDAICARVSAMAYLYNVITYLFSGTPSTPSTPRHDDAVDFDADGYGSTELTSPTDGSGLCKRCRHVTCGFHSADKASTYYRSEPLNLDDLDFLSVLGKGSFGTVVLFRWPTDRQLYAMKVRRRRR